VNIKQCTVFLTTQNDPKLLNGQFDELKNLKKKKHKD